MLASLCLLLPVILAADPSAAPTMKPSDDARKTHYVSFIKSFDEATADWDPTSLGAEELTDVANADDLSTRFSFLGTGLNGRFPFLGKTRYEMNVNSNGWLQFDTVNSPPCQYPRWVSSISGTTPNLCFQHTAEHFSYIPERTFNTSYYGGIAAFAGDLYPAYNYPTSTIKWSNTSAGDGVIVHWIDNPFYNYKTAEISVHARLTRDGHVTIYWEDLDYSQSTCEGYGDCNVARLISGLRDSISSLETSYLSTTSQQEDNALYGWSTTVKGVYPAGGISDLQSGRLFHLCPYSDSWSLTTTYLEQNAVTANVTFHTLHSSCEEQFDYLQCTYTSASVSNPTTYTGLATFNGTTDGYPSYSCGVPQSILSTLDSYIVDLQGVFSAAVTTESGAMATALSLLPETDINADTFVVQVVATGDSNLFLSNPCIASTALSLSAARLSSGCGVCSLSKNLTTCITQDFSCPSVDSPIDCQGECPYTVAPVPVSYSYDGNTFVYYNYTYVYKTSSNCCNSTEIDCAGVCNGGRKIASTLTSQGSHSDGSAMFDNYCCDPQLLTPDGTGCCYDSIPDCAGTCGGNATLDCLGICQTWLSQGTWVDCTGTCGGSAVSNVCGDCFNGTYGQNDPYSGVTVVSECRAALTLDNPAPYSSLTTGERSFLMSLRSLNLSQYLATDTFVNVRLDVSYAGNINSAGAVMQNVTLVIENPRNYTLNVSVSDNHLGSTYRDKHPSLSFDSTPFLLPAYGSANIVVAVETSDVYHMQVPMTTEDAVDWGPKPLMISCSPAMRDGMISTTNEVQYDVVFYPVTSDCGAIPDAASCGYAPWCIYCITSNPGRSLLEIEEGTTARSLYMTYMMELRSSPNFHGDLGGVCVSGFEQEDCQSVIMATEVSGINVVAMAYWLSITLLLVAAIVLILHWSMKLPEQ